MQMLIIIAITLTVALAQVPMEITYEFEDALNEEQQNDTIRTRWQWRSEASGNKTLRLEDKQGLSEIRLVLCPTPLDTTRLVLVKIDEIFYSNDGDSDLVEMEMRNGPELTFAASFNTTETRNHCDDWNVIRYKRIGRDLPLASGRHLLTLRAYTDKYGVELDYIELLATNQHPAVPLVCDADVSFVDQF